MLASRPKKRMRTALKYLYLFVADEILDSTVYGTLTFRNGDELRSKRPTRAQIFVAGAADRPVQRPVAIRIC